MIKAKPNRNKEAENKGKKREREKTNKRTQKWKQSIGTKLTKTKNEK